MIVRQLIEVYAQIPGSLAGQVEVVQELMEWAATEKRIFLKQALETRLVALFLDNARYTDALQLIAALLRELKRLDDKIGLMEVQLLESRCYHALKNLPKARAALTSARTSANAVYCPPLIQAQLDLQSGILHADDADFKTAFSYFYETMEGFTAQDDPRAILGLKYMLLCKIMLNQPHEVHSLMTGKLALKFRGPEVDAMKAVATAYQNRSLHEFEQVLRAFDLHLTQDPIVNTHLTALYDNLLEQNLIRLIEPFSRVQIAHLAQLIQLPPVQVESKLSQMILDKTLLGILDQSTQTLVVYEPPTEDKTYDSVLEAIKSMESAVENLYEKARKL